MSAPAAMNMTLPWEGPDNGVAPGTPWEDVPSDWVCPVCGLGKSEFEKA